MESRVSIDAVSSLDSPNFYEELEFAIDNLSVDVAPAFFRSVFGILNGDAPSSDKRKILSTLCVVLSVERNLGYFSGLGLLPYLPVMDQECQSEIFDLLFLVITRSPDALTNEFRSYFGYLVKANPGKGLVLLGHYAKSPSPIVPFFDPLFKHPDLFMGDKNYVSLLAYLNQKSADFKESRGEYSTQMLVNMLDGAEASMLPAVYSALCYCPAPKEYPIRAIARDLKDEAVAPYVCSFLLLADNLPAEKAMFQVLLRHSRTNKQIIYLLLKYTQTKEGCRLLLIYPQWMNMEIPTFKQTLQLFLAMMTNKYVHSKLVLVKDALIGFLTSVAATTNSGVFSLVVTILRRITIDEDFVASMSSSGLLKAYFHAAAVAEDEYFHHAAILMVSTIANVCYTKELSSMVPFLVTIIKDQGPLTKAAVLASTELCQYDPCVARFEKYSFLEELNAIRSTSKYKPQITHLMKELMKHRE